MSMTLELLIVSYGQDGLDRISRMFLPALDNVSYLICLQNPCGMKLNYPPCLDRPDVRFMETSTKGSGINRKIALSNGRGDILLMSDDDLVYDKERLCDIIKIFEDNRNLDFAAFRYSGADNKVYPETEFEMSSFPRGYYVTAFEIAVRRSSLPDNVTFSEYIGAGVERFGSGEENLFVYRMIKAGLKGRFFPIEITEHPGLTTGSRESSPAMLRGQGNWLRLRYGVFWGLLRLIRDISRRNAPWYKSLCYMFQGFILSFLYFTKDGEDR